MGRLIRIIGSILAVGCLGFLVITQIPQLPTVDLSSPRLWLGLTLALLLYVASQLAAAESWRRLLNLSGINIAPGLARGQLMVSQIGKYIPGNVAHLFGRLAIGCRDGVPARTMGGLMLLEVAITLGVGLGIAGGLLLFSPQVLSAVTEKHPMLAKQLLPLALAALLGIAFGTGVFVLKARRIALEALRPPLTSMTLPLLLHFTSFSVLGVSLWATAQAVAPAAAPDVITCTLIFAIAWTAGFVVPGAPGGIGIRDSIIVLGLALSLGEGTGLAIALLHRTVSVLGDVATFGLGWWMRRPHLHLDPRNRPTSASFAAE